MADTDGLYKRAEEAFQKRNFDYARDLFMQILVLDPNHGAARTALPLTNIKKFQAQGASSKIRIVSLKGQIEVQLKMTKDPLKKMDLLQKYLNDDPTHAKHRTHLAEILLSLEHYNGAGAEAEIALKDDPNNLAAVKVLVQAYQHLDKIKEAQEILQKVQAHVAQDRDLEKFQRDLSARLTMKAGFQDAAQDKDGFRKTLKSSAQAEELEKRHHLIQTDEDLQAVLKSLEQQLGDNPTDARIPKKIGDLVFEKKKDYPAAREWYKKASQLAPQDSVLRDKVDDCTLRLHETQVEAAAKAGDPKLAELKATLLKFKIESYERRVHDRPTDMALRFELGKAYYLSGADFLDKAIGEFQQSVKDPKKATESHLHLGVAFQKKKMFDLADKQYALAEEGVLDQNRKLSIMYNRAICNAEAGNAALAAELGKKIMEIDIAYKDIGQLVEKWQKK